MAADDSTEIESEDAGTSDAKTGKSANPIINWEKRYRGMSGKYEDLRLKYERLEESHDNVVANHEEELATVRLDAKKALKKAQDLESQFQDVQKLKEQLEKELSSQKTRVEKTTKIATDFPDLLEMFNAGDLRNSDEFENDEKYFEYLDRMNKWASNGKTPVEEKKSRAAGATPSIGTRGKDVESIKTMEELTDALDAINPNASPDDAARYEAIIRQMDKVQLQAKNKR